MCPALKVGPLFHWRMSSKENPTMQICVDFNWVPTQYLGLMNLSIQEIGQAVGLGSLTSTTLQGKIVHGGDTSWQQRKRQRRKRNTNR